MSRIIPDRILEEIRSRTSIVDVVSSRVTLKRAGALYKACCPFHKEKTPSFTVNPARESFKCFGCGEGGDVFSFLMKHDGMTFTDAVKMLAERCGVDVAFDEDDGNAARAKRLLALHVEVASFYRRCLLRMRAAETARTYLKSRGLPEAVEEAFQIGYAPEGAGTLEKFAAKHQFTLDELVQAGLGTPLDRPREGVNLHDRFRGRLMFPICDTQGRVIAFSGRVLDPARSPAKYVNSPETEIFKKSRVLYALDKAQRGIVSAPHREAIICEGQIDVIRCHACGFTTAVAAQGTAFTEEHAVLLKRYADSAVLVFDQDPAGQKAAVRTGAVLLAAGVPVRVACLDAGEDPDSFLRAHPPEAFQRVLDAAVGLMPFHVAFLQAQEEAPDSEGAVGRIAAGVLQTVAVCANEIHKARMLQEVSDLLRIPVAALEGELAGIDEQVRRQRERVERREALRERAGDHRGRTSTSGGGDFVPFHEPFVEMEPEWTFEDVQVSGSGATAVGRGATNTLDLSICELLVHHFYDDPGLVQFLMTWLPPWQVADVRCRQVVEAYYADFASGGNGVLALQNTVPELAVLIGSLAVMPNRTGFRETFSALDIARDLVLSVWRRWCADKRRALHPVGDGSDTPEAARRRAEFSIALKRLSRWETGEAVVQSLMGSHEPEAVSAAAAQRDDSATAVPSDDRPGFVDEGGATETDEPPLDAWEPDFSDEEQPGWN